MTVNEVKGINNPFKAANKPANETNKKTVEANSTSNIFKSENKKVQSNDADDKNILVALDKAKNDTQTQTSEEDEYQHHNEDGTSVTSYYNNIGDKITIRKFPDGTQSIATAYSDGGFQYRTNYTDGSFEAVGTFTDGYTFKEKGKYNKDGSYEKEKQEWLPSGVITHTTESGEANGSYKKITASTNGTYSKEEKTVSEDGSYILVEENSYGEKYVEEYKPTENGGFKRNFTCIKDGGEYNEKEEKTIEDNGSYAYNYENSNGEFVKEQKTINEDGSYVYSYENDKGEFTKEEKTINEDGSYIIKYSDNDKICISRYDKDGNFLGYEEQKSEELSEE